MAQDPVTWRDAPDLAALAAPIIEAHHTHLLGFPIRFVWRSRGRRMGKRSAGDPMASLGTAEIVSERFAAYVMTDAENEAAAAMGCPGRMFWIEIAEDSWEAMTEPQRLGLLDHELCHCGVEYPEDKPELEMFMIYHDITLFLNEVRRHGLYRSDYEELAAVMLGFEGA